MVSSAEGVAVAAAGSASPRAGVDGLVGAFRVASGLSISGGCIFSGWKARCENAVGDKWLSAELGVNPEVWS